MKKTILIVEDFASIRNFVCETLNRKGYETIGAASGKEAYEILLNKGEQVNLVLTDYNMPDGTGYDLLKKIKDNTATHKIPVIFLTTESSPQKMTDAKKLGLTAWIKKPYRAEAFFDEIEKAIKH